MPRVSVVMAARDCEEYVGQAIESVLWQTFEDWELLVADDGSEDDTRRVIGSYDDPRVRQFHQPGKVGLVATWNKLIGQAQGKYLIWQDADDWSEPNRFERLVQEMDARPELVACGSWVKKIAWKGREVSYLRRPLEHSDIVATASRGHFCGLGATKIARTDAVRTVGAFREFFDGRGAEDHDLELRLAGVGRLGNIGEFLYWWRYRRGSSSRQVTQDDPLRPFATEIATFLWQQRIRDGGLDGLMPGGNATELEGFLASLVERFRKDPLLPHRRAFRNAIANRDYGLAIALWWRIVRQGGVGPQTAKDLCYWAGSLARFHTKLALGMVDRDVGIRPPLGNYCRRCTALPGNTRNR